ncbi:MAG: AEC family transporter, partial [Candidatus Latescibacteria bacterium]|nr:AEC family transporter [Candidatus Latescibacterota bacterium]
MFLDLLTTCFFGITGVLLLGVSAMLVLSGIRRADAVTDILSRLFIRIALPSLVFTNMADNFSLSGASYWWMFPLLGIALFAAGGVVAWLYLSIDGSIRRRGVFAASVIFYNSIMLPLAIAPVLFGGERLASFYNHLFLFNILTIPTFFSAGLWIIHTTSETRFSLWKAVNPPNIAVVLGILCALPGRNAGLSPGRAWPTRGCSDG